jgi:hypothetical protein
MCPYAARALAGSGWVAIREASSVSVPNVRLTPHTAGYTEELMADDCQQSVDLVLGVLQARDQTRS